MNIDLHKTEMTIEELELLRKLIRRASILYNGCNFRDRLNEHQQNVLGQASYIISDTVNDILDEYKDQRKDTILE